MYERSAIVLERYLDKYFGFNEEYNLRDNYKNYSNIVKEVKNYQELVEEEEDCIEKFDEIAKEIEYIQIKQSKLSDSNQKMEELRIQLFSDLSETPKELEKKLNKVELTIQKNNKELEELGEEFIKNLTIFLERQKERNKCSRKKRTAQSNHINYTENAKQIFEQIDGRYVKNAREFLEGDKEKIKKEITDLMIKNGKNEKIAFNKQVIENAVDIRISIAEKEIECYLAVFDKSKKIFQEVENEEIKINKFEKTLRDVTVKLEFLEVEKEYIIAFLDNERLTVINGIKVHKKMMEDACKGFESDITQINQLYELILREISNKPTKKAYNELYNKGYLKNIEESEKTFEEEANNIKIKMGTVINSNYWRIQGVKNVYTIFQQQVSEKFEKDLSELQIEEEEEVFIEDDEDIIIEAENVIIEDEKEEKEMIKTEKIKEKVQKDKTKKVEEKYKEIEEDEFDNETEELPKAMKNMKGKQNKNKKENKKEDKVQKIMQNTRKRQIQELNKKQEENKGILNKLFKK